MPLGGGVIAMAEARDNWLSLLDAARAGDAPTVRRLLSAGTNPNCRDILSGYTALHQAATAGHLEVVRLLVEAGAEITDRRNTVYESALAGAVVAGRTEVVAYLLAHRANPFERLYGDDRPLLEEAQEAGYVQMAELLHEALRRPRRSR
jgi:ankyrin repeat protein